MQIKNSCAKCIFAQRDEEGNQIDCAFGRLDDYRNYLTYKKSIPLDVTEDFSKVVFNKETKSYDILERLCNLNHAEDSDWVKDTPPEEWAEKAFKDAQLKFKVVILATKNHPIEELVASLKSAQNQTLRPVSVHFILANKEISRPKLAAALELEEYAGIRRILSEVEMSTWEILDEERVATKESNNPFYNYVMVMEPSKKMGDSYLSNIDVAVNRRMEIISLILPESGYHGIVYSPIVRDAVGRDYDGTMEEKIKASGGTVWEAHVQ